MAKKKKIGLIIGIILIILSIIFYFLFIKSKIIIKNNLEFEINSKVKIKEVIKKSKNVKLTNEDDFIYTSKLGRQNVNLKYQDKIKRRSIKKVTYKIVDTKAPKIKYEKILTTKQNEEIDLLANVEVTDNSKEKIKAQVNGQYNFNKIGEYNLKYTATDKSGNRKEEEFILKVEKSDDNINNQSNIKNQESNDINQSNKLPYYIKINRTLNVVMIYGLDNNGNYTNLIKVFTCSTGSATPIGIFKTTQKYVWRPLVGNVYGQYATRIVGSILFHSVPYTKQSKDSLEWEEYNKLGTAASLGCIRLRIIDVKWIYDNCPIGTTVEIYDSDSLEGISKPVYEKIDSNSPNKGWDPTDPDPNNPW